MNKSLELCVELNNVLYECKIQLPKKHFLQRRIDDVMEHYQSHFREQYQAKAHEDMFQGNYERHWRAIEK